MGLLNKIVKPKTERTEKIAAYCFMHNDEDQIRMLRSNPNFELATKTLAHKGFVGRTIFKYYCDYENVSLQRDPKNKTDKNAVMILLDGEFFGYINKEDAPRVGQLLKKDAISDCHMTITGGPYRRILSEEHSTTGASGLNVTISITYMG